MKSLKRETVILAAILILSGILAREADGEGKERPRIAQLITQQAQEAVTAGVAEDTGPVTVHEKLYLIFVLNNYIDPATCEVVPNSKPTKVYVDTKHYPVSVFGIAQKIGIIDHVRVLQKTQLTPDQLKQEIDRLTEKRKVLAAIQFGEDSVKILTTVPTKISPKALIKWIGKKAADKFFKKMAELNEELSINLANAISNYNKPFAL